MQNLIYLYLSWLKHFIFQNNIAFKKKLHISHLFSRQNILMFGTGNSSFEQGLEYNKQWRFVMKSNQPHLSHHHHSDSILDMQNHLVNKKLTSRSDSVHDTSTPGPQGSSPTGAPGGGRANCHVLDQNDPQQCCSGVGAVGSILENILYSVVFHGASSSSRASSRSN